MFCGLQDRDGPSLERDEGGLPALLLQADRLDYQNTVAMFPRHLVRSVTSMTSQSHNLLHHSHSHTNVKVNAAAESYDNCRIVQSRCCPNILP